MRLGNERTATAYRRRLDRARAGDRRARDLDRRAEADDGAHPVGGPPVARQAVRSQEIDPGEQVERAYRVAGVREGTGDAAVLDEEGSVARRPRHRGPLGVGRVGVVEAGDEHAALHRADQLLAPRVTAGHREVPSMAPDAVATRIRRVPRAARAEPLRGLTAVDHALP